MKITHKQLRDLIRDSMINEAGSSYGYTGGARALSADQVNTLRRAGFDVANVNPGNLTGEMQSALDWVAQGNNISDWVPEDAMDADQLAAAGAEYDVDGNLLSTDDTDADNDGVPDALEEDLANLVANAAERLSMGQIVELMLNALSDEMHGGFPMQDVISSVEKWSSSAAKQHAAGDYNDMNESNIIKRWEDLAGLSKEFLLERPETAGEDTVSDWNQLVDAIESDDGKGWASMTMNNLQLAWKDADLGDQDSDDWNAMEAKIEALPKVNLTNKAQVKQVFDVVMG